MARVFTAEFRSKDGVSIYRKTRAKSVTEHDIVYTRVPKVKPKSRATRCADTSRDIQNLVDEITAAIDEINNQIADPVLLADKIISEQINIIYNAFGRFDYSEAESLKEEIENWRDGITGTGLENSQKYSDLEECISSLEEACCAFEDANSSIPAIEPKENGSAIIGEEKVEFHIYEAEKIKTFFEETEYVLDQMRSGCESLDNTEFPGMFG